MTSSLLVCCKACTCIRCTSWYFRQPLVPFTSGDMQPWVPLTTETIQNELSLSFWASCSHYLNPVQTCWVNTFHIELIYLLETSFSSVNGMRYELWKFRKNHPSLQSGRVVGCHHYESHYIIVFVMSSLYEPLKYLWYVFPVLSWKVGLDKKVGSRFKYFLRHY